jgi:putative PIN family toxin of toxin-antitoxin system
MRVVLDSNVLLSAMISPHGYPNLIYCAWCADRFDLVTSKTQLHELRRASRYPKFKNILQPYEVGTLLNNLQPAILLEKLNSDIEADDPNDSFLLAMALAGHTDYLVTGDHRAGLLQMKNIGRTRMVNPTVFCLEALKY